MAGAESLFRKPISRSDRRLACRLLYGKTDRRAACRYEGTGLWNRLSGGRPSLTRRRSASSGSARATILAACRAALTAPATPNPVDATCNAISSKVAGVGPVTNLMIGSGASRTEGICSSV